MHCFSPYLATPLGCGLSLQETKRTSRVCCITLTACSRKRKSGKRVAHLPLLLLLLLVHESCASLYMLSMLSRLFTRVLCLPPRRSAASMGVSASTPSAQQVYDQYRLHQDGLHIRSISVSVIAAQEAQGAVAASQEVEEGGRSNNDGSEATTAAAAAAAAAAGTTASSLRMVQEDDGELTFDALAYDQQPPAVTAGTSSPSPEAVATAVTWICDPAAARKTASTSLLRLSVSEHDEQLQFSFRTRLLPLDDDHASDTAATSTLAFACTESPVALERVLAERKRAGVGRILHL